MQSTLDKPVQHTQLHPLHQPVRRVGLVDRAALHLGVALIKWGRRPALGADERRANVIERAVARAARDARVAAERDRALLNYSQLTLVR